MFSKVTQYKHSHEFSKLATVDDFNGLQNKLSIMACNESKWNVIILPLIIVSIAIKIDFYPLIYQMILSALNRQT